MTKKVRLKINSLAPLGDGVAIENGQFHYVPGAIPGDVVDAEILTRNKREVYTKLLKVVTPSAHRREAQCPVFGKCGGCTLLHADETLQRNTRRQALIRKFGINDVPFISAEPSLGYRRLARLHMNRGRNGNVRLGFFEKRAHRIVDIDHCPILEAKISKVLPTLKKGMLRGLKSATLRIATGNEGVYLHVKTEDAPKPVFYEEALRAVPSLLQGVVLDWDGIVATVAGGDALTVDATDDTPFRMPAGSFGQANLSINKLLVGTVASWVGEMGCDEMLELYAGAGNFSFALRKELKKISMVELDANACHVAALNFGDLSQVRIICDDALAAYQRMGRNVPLVLLDPPRTGAADLVKAMAMTAHEAIIYVSCNPATLKRDLAYLEEGGYVVKQLVGFDMFPQTTHLEVAVWLVRN
ncbi:MAG: class I SAM-dependent RNA methyltransferase [Deltaproteobacteria bacterium]|nr:class I SAM-dependent RNA methyltransferase [Deltaproteobacteria bacterium]